LFCLKTVVNSCHLYWLQFNLKIFEKQSEIKKKLKFPGKKRWTKNAEDLKSDRFSYVLLISVRIYDAALQQMMER